mmetsp:Transcript_4361/g.6137  ORF Transcript_4361/g.6137 Transcript_4361/m.6137 type:complete len:253 (+) Transcript_4361:234-992(+)
MSNSTSAAPALSATTLATAGCLRRSSSSTGPVDLTAPCLRKARSETSGMLVSTRRSTSAVLAAVVERCLSRSARPMASSSRRKPSLARMCRVSSAAYWKKLTTWSGVPGNRFRSSSFCVVMPTGQLLVWHTRAMMQPSATIAMVPKPNSSAPISAPITTSHPDLMPPSTRSSVRSRSPFCIKVRCTSVRPSSQGEPACLMEDSGEAPVPPSWPEIWMMSASALATPAATVPMPISETSLTETPAAGLIWCRS